jgi:glyoxylate carboligase
MRCETTPLGGFTVDTGLPPRSAIMTDFAGDAAAAAIRSALERSNAGAAFGLPGSSNQVLFKALREGRTRLIVPTHELAAAFMAGSYGRVAGRPGILLTICGPGFAYALPGIAEAWQDSAPLVHIVDAPPEARISDIVTRPSIRPPSFVQWSKPPLE